MGLRYFSDVTTLAYDPQKCKGCGRCAEVCPHGVFALSGGKAEIVDKDACIECGACKKNCPFGAIDVRSGVGCAAAVIGSFISRKKPSCGLGGNSGCC